MAVVSLWCGGVTASTADVRAKVDSGTVIELGVSSDATLSDPTLFPGVADPDNMYSFDVSDLDPSTRYYYQVQVDGAGTGDTGQFLTHPTVGQPGSFRFGFASCAGFDPVAPGVTGTQVPSRMSNSDEFDVIRQNALQDDWLFFAHLGDMHYYDIGSEEVVSDHDVAQYRRAWDDVLLQPNQQALYRDVPLVYMWDDHDYGPNNSGASAPGRLNAQQVYREKVPHYPIAAERDSATGSHPIYQSFIIGRVLILVTDKRSSRGEDSILGQQQHQWMRDTLASSTAEVCVWISTQPWLYQYGNSPYQGYEEEAGDLADMITDVGWDGRIAMVSGDSHHMGLDDGDVGLGGMPLLVANPIDVPSSGDTSPINYSFSSTYSRGQYGVVDIDDDGQRIRVSLIGRVSNTVWKSYSFSVDTEEDEEDQPALPATEAVPRTRVTWLGCDLISGRIIAELPEITGSIKRIIGSAESTSLSLPIPLAGPGALGRIAFQATHPGQTMLVAVVNDVPSWGGIVLNRQGGIDGTLDLACVTLEGYLDRRYVRTKELRQVDQADIARALLMDAEQDGINIVPDAPKTGVVRDREYADGDDATVLKRLEELMDVQGGPEFTIDVDWADRDRTAIAKILRVRQRIGREDPDVVFENTRPSPYSLQGASDTRYTYSEDYSDGKGANHVIATSSGEGDARPASEPAVDIQPGWPRYEHRISPSTSIKDTDVLDEHAQSELELLKNGTRTWELSLRWDAPPRLNVDWRLGDTVSWNLKGHCHPDGVTGSGRVIGWELDMQSGVVDPILLEPREEQA